MENFEEKVLRSAKGLGYGAYLEWLKQQLILKRKLKLFFANLEEIHIDNKKMCDTIHQLEKRTENINFLESEDMGKKLKQILQPLNVSVEQSSLGPACRELNYYKMVWTKSVEQGVETLEHMCKNNMSVGNMVCDIELLLILIHFFKAHPAMHIENAVVLANVKFPKNKIYKDFVKAHSIEAHYMDALEFWESKYPGYVLAHYF